MDAVRKRRLRHRRRLQREPAHGEGEHEAVWGKIAEKVPRILIDARNAPGAISVLPSTEKGLTAEHRPPGHDRPLGEEGGRLQHDRNMRSLLL